MREGERVKYESLSSQTGKRQHILRGHTAAVTCILSLHLSSEEDLLITGSLDNSLRVGAGWLDAIRGVIGGGRGFQSQD